MTPSDSIEALIALGIPRQKALYALKEHNNEAEAAADWCFTEGAEWTPGDLLSTFHSRPADAESGNDLASSRIIESIPLSRPSERPTARQSHTGTAAPTKLPSHWIIQPGKRVSLVQKQDQSSGKRTEGVVAQVLTKGDHPRGIKVRLVDGTVGRVQDLLS